MLFIINATNVMFGFFNLQILYIISEFINNMHHATYICDSFFFFFGLFFLLTMQFWHCMTYFIYFFYKYSALFY